MPEETKKSHTLWGAGIISAAILVVGILYSQHRGGSPEKLSAKDTALLVDTPTCIYQLHNHGEGYTGPLIRTMKKDHSDTAFNVLLPDTTNPVIDTLSHRIKKDTTGKILYHVSWYTINKKFVWVVPIGN